MPMLTDADIAATLEEPMMPPPSDAEVAWSEMCKDLRKAQFGLLRLQCPMVPTTQLDAIADATTAHRLQLQVLAHRPWTSLGPPWPQACVRRSHQHLDGHAH